MASFTETLTSILHSNYPSMQFGKAGGTNTTFVGQYSSSFFRQSVRDLYINNKSNVKWRAHVTGKSSESMLNKSVSIVNETYSEFKSKFSKALGSSKRTLQQAIAPLEPIFTTPNGDIPVSFAVGLGMMVVFIVIAIKGYMARQSGDNGRGSVSDLIKRGQLRSDRRAISRPLNYEDPFNNPLVRMSEKNSTVKICGKVFRLAPVTLTEEKAMNHQNRRIRAYQWKRPTVFLKEGDPVPEGVDPETVRWIPSNHPFATASNDIDEDFAQRNIYQKRGVPSRLRAEHEALQKKMMEATQDVSI
ncbi:protein MULTIPLE CHLOROPLAST DIVISION SITE 1 isoform X2 [Cryptomeria japonica]|uniref:protein MULTIPLE CHLOROPLAST DIVISION SITE 1 isoform X2 n=1 Tax=Cryptomeria japonica TaxID=3369 RepID=UPI0025ACA0CA|nr:protein MULTIPLE CHLOROPLAST DIVISION SITE 1 isoform X2 [Cryptomeria japonica]